MKQYAFNVGDVLTVISSVVFEEFINKQVVVKNVDKQSNYFPYDCLPVDAPEEWKGEVPFFREDELTSYKEISINDCL